MSGQTVRNILGIFLFLWLVTSCDEKIENPNKNLTLEAFSEMKTPSFAINSHRIREHLDHIVRADTTHLAGDKQVRHYYGYRRPFLWIDRHGIDARADSLVSYLRRVEETGLSPRLFRTEKIESDLKRLRALDLDEDDNHINWVMARLEYNLTKAFLRYVVGQRFGYVNPNHLLNNLCVKDSDSLHVEYFHVFDIPMKHPTTEFFESSFGKIAHDSVPIFLQSVQPRNALYQKYCNYLKQNSLSDAERKKVLCNIERSKWSLDEYPEQYKKYVVVNVPAFMLYAVDEDSVMTMRVGCGAKDTKTPLLTSKIKRMDVNPQWVVPKSIAEGIVYRHDYLQKEHMFIRDRKKGKVGYEYASREKIMKGEQYIVQEGGPGNSLGRIIFRFDNNHAVYLHDTSSPWVFNRSQRAVSHGCIRLQKPYEMAVFLLKKKDEELMEKIKYSMTADVSRHEELPEDERPEVEEDKLVNTIHVDPEIPLFITYYTLYPDTDGVMRSYKDVYKYDEAIIKELLPYIQ